MKVAEIVSHLEAWKTSCVEVEKRIECLRELTGAMPDCELLAPIYAMQDAYTKAVGAIVGDDGGWMSWYVHECDMGRNPMSAFSVSGIEIRVKTLRHLARVIAW